LAKTKLLELDIVRAIAILAVLTIHGTSEATVDLQSGSLAQSLYLAVNKLSNFAVPVFIFLSGVVLFYRYSGDWSARQALVFYRKRIQQIVIPYLIWSLFYYLYNQWLYDRANLHFHWNEFLDLLPWADASYHLYFIIIIVQFYLLFPLLMSLCASFGWFRRWFWLLGILVQAVFVAIHHWGSPIEHFSSLCVDYFSLFTLGGFIGLYYEDFIAWINRRYFFVLPAAVLCGVIFMMCFQLEERELLHVSTLWYHLLFTLYAMLAGMCFIWIGRWLLRHAPKVSKAFLALGAASFGIYLVHPAVLSYWHIRYLPEQIYSYHVYTLAGFLLVLFVPWLLVYIYGKLAPAVFRGIKRKA
jgi:peptidoglycan/LPS O-acetylase OafA/YrhL